MNPRRRTLLHPIRWLVVPILVVLTAAVLVTLHWERQQAVTPPAQPSHPTAAAPTPTQPAATTPETNAPVNPFHSRTIDTYLARIEAERIAAEKAAAEKAAAEAARLAAEKAAAEKAAADKAAADAAAAAAAAKPLPVVAPVPVKKEFEIVYHGMMKRVDGTVMAYVENRTDKTSFFYQAGDAFLFGTIQVINPRSVVIKFGADTRELNVNEPIKIPEP